MSNVNITEKYALCVLKEKNTLKGNDLTPYLVVSMIVESMLNGNLTIKDKNKVVLNAEEPTVSYDKILYDVIKDMKKDEVSLRYILSSICYSLSTKNLKSIISALKDKMVEDGLITLENKKGIIGDKEVIKIDEDKFTNIVNEIKTEILEKGNLSEELILLTSLLNSTRFLKNIFSKYEKEKIDDVLKEIENTDIAENVKVAQSAIGTMHAIIVSSMVNATHT